MPRDKVEWLAATDEAGLLGQLGRHGISRLRPSLVGVQLSGPFDAGVGLQLRNPCIYELFDGAHEGHPHTICP